MLSSNTLHTKRVFEPLKALQMLVEHLQSGFPTIGGQMSVMGSEKLLTIIFPPSG